MDPIRSQQHTLHADFAQKQSLGVVVTIFEMGLAVCQKIRYYAELFKFIHPLEISDDDVCPTEFWENYVCQIKDQHDLRQECFFYDQNEV